MERPKQSSQSLPQNLSLSNFSKESQEVLEFFGLEAPHRLNEYCIALEDALIKQVGINTKLQEQVQSLKSLLEEHDIKHN